MTEIEIKRNELKAVMFQNMNAVAVREALIILEDLEDMLVKTCNEPHVSKCDGIEREALLLAYAKWRDEIVIHRRLKPKELVKEFLSKQ